MSKKRAKNYANSKGYSGEKEIEKILQENFPEFKKRIMRTSHPEAMKFSYNGDVMCFEERCILSEFAWEVKRHERENVRSWLAKIKDDVGTGNQRPLVVHRRNNTEWIVSLELKDFLYLLNYLQGYKDEHERQDS